MHRRPLLWLLVPPAAVGTCQSMVNASASWSDFLWWSSWNSGGWNGNPTAGFGNLRTGRGMGAGYSAVGSKLRSSSESQSWHGLKGLLAGSFNQTSSTWQKKHWLARDTSTLSSRFWTAKQKFEMMMIAEEPSSRLSQTIRGVEMNPCPVCHEENAELHLGLNPWRGHSEWVQGDSSTWRSGSQRLEHLELGLCVLHGEKDCPWLCFRLLRDSMSELIESQASQKQKPVSPTWRLKILKDEKESLDDDELLRELEPLDLTRTRSLQFLTNRSRHIQA